MSRSRPKNYFVSVDQYLAGEEVSDVRLEVTLGNIYASIPFKKGDARPWYLQAIREDG